MSNQQNNQRLRRNGSPSMKQGPIRATQQFGLASPSRGLVRCSPTSSPAPKDSARNRSRPLSETGLLSGRRSPSSPCGLRIVEKPKPIIAGRSNSFDNVMAAPYLSGQWPKDGQWQQQKDSNSHYLLINTSDKQTQTPDEWEEAGERRRSASKIKSRSQSVGSGDQQLKNIKHKLQRNGGLSTSSSAYQQRLSPVFPASPCLNQPAGTLSTSMPIKIPTPTSSSNGLTSAPRGTPGKARGSVEGLNQEVEKLIISGRRLDATECSPVDHLDGHRAPVMELLSQTTRSIDTQTPSQIVNGDGFSDALPIMLEVQDGGERSSSQSSDNSLSRDEEEDDQSSRSVSPAFIPGQFELEDSGLLEHNTDFESISNKMPSSPRPNSEFMRLPPDGAEKIKIIDELTIIPTFTEFRHLAPSKAFQPSATSAFQYLPAVHRRKLESLQTAVEDAH